MALPRLAATLRNVMNRSNRNSQKHLINGRAFVNWLKTDCRGIAKVSELDDANIDDEIVADVEGTEDTANEIVKTYKFCVLLSYCGQGYHGMQTNKPRLLPTIEDELLDAFLKANVINREQYEHPGKMKYQRCSRTDTNVSALRQIISGYFAKELPDKIEQINGYLPKQIQLVGAKKVVRSFDAQIFCNCRTYVYLMPTYALSLPDELTSDDFRLTRTVLDDFNRILSIFKGSKSFHNYTSGKVAGDDDVLRYIMEIDCSPPFVTENGIEYAAIRIKGQSFMLHQIRKMVATAIGVIRGIIDEEELQASFSSVELSLPKAPGNGLMLEQIDHTYYNRKYGGKENREPLFWDEFNEVIEKFKRETVYASIFEIEKKDRCMLKWLRILPVHGETSDAYFLAAKNSGLFKKLIQQ